MSTVALPLPVPPSRSSSTDSTETVKATAPVEPIIARGRVRPIAPNRKPPNPARSRERARNADRVARASSEAAPRRPLASTSSSRSTSRGFANPNRPVEPVAPASTTRRPSLTLSTKLGDRLDPITGLPSPAPSPSRLCPALPLPLLAANEASIQLSSVVVAGELDKTAAGPNDDQNGGSLACAGAGGAIGGGGARGMLETLRDKGTLVTSDPETPHDVQIPGLSQPFVLPALERNPRLPANLFDCTSTISLPDLPPTGQDSEGEAEDQVMNTLPSPVSPTTSPPFLSDASAAEMHRTRSRSGGPRYSVGGGGGSHPSSRKVSFSIVDSRSTSPPTVGRSAASSRRSSGISGQAASSSILKAPTHGTGSAFLGKRRQVAGLETTRNRELLEAPSSSASSGRRRLDGVSGLGDSFGAVADELETRDRNIKKRPALISYTSFEEEFGLKPPRLEAEYDDDEDGRDRAGLDGLDSSETKKERKWWHLSG